MFTSDSEIQQAVLRELKWDTRVEETEVGVEVDSGVVTLTGTVSSFGKRIAAQEAAHRVGAVLDVANDISVKVPGTSGPNDTELAAAVRRALEWDVFVPEKRIRSTVSAGWVTLDGDVDYWSQREDAQRVIGNLTGIRGLTNKIEVVPLKGQAIPNEVKRAIEHALERHALREAKHIEIDMKDGRVVVSGVVHSWREKDAVIGAAKGTVGVRGIEDHLRIEPYAG